MLITTTQGSIIIVMKDGTLRIKSIDIFFDILLDILFLLIIVLIPFRMLHYICATVYICFPNNLG